MKKRKKILGALLCCIMIITALPVTSKADTVTDKSSVAIKYTNSVGKVYLSEEENLAVSQVFMETLGMEIGDKTVLAKYSDVEIIDDNTTFSIDYDNSSIAKDNIKETYILTYSWFKDSEGKIDAQKCFVGPDQPMEYQFFKVNYEEVVENDYKIEDINAGSLMIIATPYNDNSITWTYAITKSDYEKVKNEVFDFLTEDEIKDDSDNVEADSYEVKLSSDNTSVSVESFNTILAENATKDVVIKNADGVTFTFAKGTMSAVDGKTEYDFGTSVIADYSKAAELSSVVTKDNFVLQIDYNYSGQLPAKASITFNVGSELAGKTLYYYLYNTDKTYKIVQSVVVADDGSVTVKQDHCSTYVLTSAELVSETETPENSTPVNETPATGDSTNYVIFIILAVISLGTVVLVSRKRMLDRA